jgi:hypothetical protein
VRLAFDGDSENPEIEVSGTSSEFLELGRQLVAGISELAIESRGPRDEHYPQLLGALVCRTDESVDDPSLVAVSLGAGGVLLVSGGAEGLRKLGQSCLNVFADAQEGEHIHLDYFEGNQLLAATNCTLILMVRTNPSAQ